MAGGADFLAGGDVGGVGGERRGDGDGEGLDSGGVGVRGGLRDCRRFRDEVRIRNRPGDTAGKRRIEIDETGPST